MIPLDIIIQRLKRILADYGRAENHDFFNNLIEKKDPLARQAFMRQYLTDETYFNSANQSAADLFADIFIETIKAKKRIDPNLNKLLPDREGNYSLDALKNLLVISSTIGMACEYQGIERHLTKNQSKYTKDQIAEILRQARAGKVILVMDNITHEEKLLTAGNAGLPSSLTSAPADNAEARYVPSYSYALPTAETAGKFQAKKSSSLENSKTETKSSSVSTPGEVISEIKEGASGNSPVQAESQPVSGATAGDILQAKQSLVELGSLENVKNEAGENFLGVEDFQMDKNGEMNGTAVISNEDPENPAGKINLKVKFHGYKNPAGELMYSFAELTDDLMDGSGRGKPGRKYVIHSRDLPKTRNLFANRPRPIAPTKSKKPKTGGGGGQQSEDLSEDNPMIPRKPAANPADWVNYRKKQEELKARKEETPKNERPEKKQEEERTRTGGGGKPENNPLFTVLKWSAVGTALGIAGAFAGVIGATSLHMINLS